MPGGVARGNGGWRACIPHVDWRLLSESKEPSPFVGGDMTGTLATSPHA